MRIFDRVTLEDVLLWYTLLQDVSLKQSCDNTVSKFDITVLLLMGQAKRNFFQFKTEVWVAEIATKGLIIATKCGAIEKAAKEVLEKFRDYVFKKFAAQYQVSFLHHILHRPEGATIKVCAARL